MCVRKTSGDLTLLNNSGFRGTTWALALYDSKNRSVQISPCQSQSCEHICVAAVGGVAECICREDYTLNQDGRTCSHINGLFGKGVLISNSTHVCMFEVRIMNNVSHDKRCILNPTGAAITHIDTDTKTFLIFFSDRTKREIFIHNRINKATSSLTTTSVVSGMVYDWLDKNMFWTESDTGRLKLVSLTTRSSLNVFSGLSSPKELTIDPYHRTLYWVENDGSAKIIKSGKTDGTQKQTIISGTYSTNPSGLYFNTLTNRLYWETSGALRSSLWNGTDIKFYFSIGTTKHLSIYKGYVIWTTDTPDIRSSRLSSSYIEFIQPLSSFGSVTGMVIFDPAIQRSEKGSCEDANGGCQQICVASQFGRTCQCSLGFTLQADETSCSSTPIYNDFLLTTDNSHKKIYQISLVDKNVIALDLPNLNSPVGVVYSFKTAMVIWSEYNTGQIRQSFLSGENVSVIHSLGSAYALSLAIDFSTNNVYFAQSSTLALSGSIRVVRDGVSPKTIVPSLIEPKGVAIYPSKGFLFFTVYNDNSSHISRCYMDGSIKTTLVSVSTKYPKGLALDYDADRLYWADAFYNKVQSINLNGGDRREIRTDSYMMFAIALGGSYIYYTSWFRQMITKLNKHTNQQESWMEHTVEFGRLDSLDIYIGRTHPVNSLCSSQNGKCSTYCLPTVSGRTCACEDGVSLSSDSRTCHGVTQCSSFIPNGFLDSNCLRYVGLSCDYHCSSTYQKNSSIQNITCGNSGSWNMPLQYLCNRIKCPTDIPIGFVQNCDATIGTTCSFRCKQGFFGKNDVSSIHCLPQGQWSKNVSALCSRRECHTEIPNGFFVGFCDGSLNTNCQYDCVKGYNRNPLYSSASCLSNGVWNPDIPQLCISEKETAPSVTVIAAGVGGSVGLIVLICIVVVAVKRDRKNEPHFGMFKDSDLVSRNRRKRRGLHADITDDNLQRNSTYDKPYDDPKHFANNEHALDISVATSSDNLTIYADITDVDIQRDSTYDKPYHDPMHDANNEHALDIFAVTSTDSGYLHPYESTISNQSEKPDFLDDSFKNMKDDPSNLTF